jgi:hypothetical protein
MSDYPLVRARSTALVRSGSRPTVLVSRSYSVPDVSAYIRSSDRYKPYWPLYYTYYPYRYNSTYYPARYYRDYSLYDSYWYDRYYYFSPLYHSSLFPSRRYYYSDGITNPYYWWGYPGSNYWTRYKSYYYDYPSSYRSYYDPYYYSYLSSAYRPYRSYLLDTY